MSKTELERLQELQDQLRKEIADEEAWRVAARNVIDLEKRKKSIQTDIKKLDEAAKRLQAENAARASFQRVGVIDRFLVAGLGAADPGTAVYRTNQAIAKSLDEGESYLKANLKGLKTFGKQYPKTVYENLLTAASGYDARTGGRKGGGDIFRDQFGVKGKWTSRVGGLAWDVMTSPTNLLPSVGLGKAGASAGAKSSSAFVSKASTKITEINAALRTQMSKIVDKSPMIQQGIDALGKRFDIFWELRKTMPKDELTKLQQALIPAIETKDFTALIAMGLNPTKFTNKATAGLGAKAKNIKELLKSFSKDADVSLADLWKTFQGDVPFAGKWGSKEFWSDFAKKPLDTFSRVDQARLTTLLDDWSKIIVRNPKQKATSFYEFGKRFVDQAKSGELFQSARTAAADELKRLTAELDKIKNIPIKAKDQPTYDTLKTIFGDLLPKVEATGAKKVLTNVSSVITQGYKRVMSWSPRFHSRNLTGAIFQGAAEGTTIGDYFRAMRLLGTQGRTDPALYEQITKAGIRQQPGMLQQPLSRIPGKIASAGESWVRSAYVIGQKRLGVPTEQALQQQQKVFYKYAPEWFTEFERNLSHFLPFWPYMKGQALYHPGALLRRAPFLHRWGLAVEDSMPETYLKHSRLTPDYFKNQSTIGSIGGFGLQLDDALRTIGGDFGGLFSQTSPHFRSGIEMFLGWNFFKNKPIAKDDKAGQWANMPKPIQWMLGYDRTSDTVDPYRKYFIETFLGPGLGPVLNLADPNKAKYTVGTSIRPYSTDLHSADMQDQMTRKEEDEYAQANAAVNLLRKILSPDSLFNFGAARSNAAGLPDFKLGKSVFGSDPISQFAGKKVKDLYEARGLPPEAFGKRFIPGMMSSESMVYINLGKRLGEEAAKAMLNAGPDIGQNVADSYATNMETQLRYFSSIFGPEYKDREDVQLWAKAQQAQYEATRPRTFEEPAFFGPEHMIYRKGFSDARWQTAYNKAYDEMVQFASKTADIWRAASGASYYGIERGRDADIEGVRMQARGQGAISKEQVAMRIAAIIAKAQKDMEELDARGHTASANLLKAWADGEIDALHKIEYERIAAQEEFLSSKDYSYYRDNHMYERMKQHQDSIDRKYAAKRNEQLAKEAKEYMEIIEQSAKGTADRVIKALDDVYKRGGMNIDEYYTQRLQALTGKQTTIAGGALQQIGMMLQTGVASAPEGSMERAKLQGIQGFAQQFYDDIKNVTNPEEALRLVEEALALFSERLEGVDAKGMAQQLQHLQKVANELKVNIEEAAREARDAKQKFDEAIRALQQETQDLQLKTAFDMTQGGLVHWAFTKPSEKFGADTTPKYQWGRDFTSEQQAKQLRDFDAGMVADFVQKQRDIQGYQIFRDQMAGEGDRAYMDALSTQIEQIETIWATHEERVAVMGEEGAEKYNQIRDKMIEKEKERNMLLVSMEKETLMNRMQMSQQIAQGIGNIAENLYEASGRQSKEAFYVMKAAKFAEAAIAGAAAVIKAYDAAAGNPYLGTAYAAIIAAQVGVQLGIIAAQTIQGRAQGGPITGGSGKKDDVPIMAMGGEYVIRKSAVDKYGLNVMDAINNGLLPLASMNFSIPAAPTPDTSKRMFSEGGIVAASNMGEITESMSQELQIVNVIDPKLMDKYVAGADGQRTILNVLAANSYEVKRMLR